MNLTRKVRTRLFLVVCLVIASTFFFVQTNPSEARVTIRNEGPSNITDLQVSSMFANKEIPLLHPGEAISFVMTNSAGQTIRITSFTCQGKPLCHFAHMTRTIDDKGEYYRFSISCDLCSENEKPAEPKPES
jgi:hypothetical protein